MAKTQKYEFSVRKGFHVKKETAQRVGRLIVELTDQGVYSPERLVEEASDPRCPAHADFEWNDSTAAHKWRIEQARKYDQAITYTLLVTGPRGGKSKPIEFRAAYAFEDADGKPYYRAGTEVVRNKDLLQDLKTRALAALQSWQRQYDMLSSIGEFVEIFRAIKKVTKPVAKKPKKAKVPAGASSSPLARVRTRSGQARPRPVAPAGTVRSVRSRVLHA